MGSEIVRVICIQCYCFLPGVPDVDDENHALCVGIHHRMRIAVVEDDGLVQLIRMGFTGNGNIALLAAAAICSGFQQNWQLDAEFGVGDAAVTANAGHLRQYAKVDVAKSTIYIKCN